MKRKINLLLSINVMTALLGLSSCNSNQNTSEQSNSQQSEDVFLPSESALGNSNSNEESVSELSSDESNSASEESQSTESVESETIMSESASEKVEVIVNENFNYPTTSKGNPTVETMSELSPYTPTTFDASTVTQTKETICEGLELVKNTVKFTGRNKTAVIDCVVADLDKVNIVAGSFNNNISPLGYTNRSVPVAQADAWEKANPGKKALAVTNADFFGNDKPVNAFVKDGVILKDSHNQDANDLPESSPMLFGVSSAGARIGAMTSSTSRTVNYQAKLSYSTALEIYDENVNLITTLTAGYINSSNTKKTYSIFTKAGTYTVAIGTIYKVKLIQQDECADEDIRGCIVDKTVEEEITYPELTEEEVNNGYALLAVGSKVEYDFELNSYFNFTKHITSPSGGLWDYYDTILGARHSLVENGIIPATLSQETSNGAANPVPHSAVGIMSDGKVVIFSVEDLHYGGKALVCTGCTLPELGDFARYFGCYDAANFDGGGSSQLCTKGVNDTNWTVQTKSSDTGSSDPYSTRAVLNSIIVTTK